jgi:hypothetical protein
MTRYRVTLYNTILQDIYVDAEDGDEAGQLGWGNPDYPNLPEGFTLGDEMAWEVYDIQEADDE